MRRIDAYRVKRGDNLGDIEYWNKRLEDIDLRLAVTEDAARTIDEAAARVERMALERVTGTLTPLVAEAVTRLTEVVTIFGASSTSPLTIALGEQVLIVADGQRHTFAPLPYLVVYDAADMVRYMTARVVSFARDTGRLVLDVTRVSGAGTGSDWRLAPIATTDELEWLVNAASDAAAAAAGYSDAAHQSALAAQAATSNALSIGDVSSGAAAIATITGTPPAQVLHLTLPAGPPGRPGRAGATGAATLVDYGVLITHDDGIASGEYFAEWAAAASTHDRLYAAITAGDPGAVAMVSLVIGGSTVLDPVTVTAGVPVSLSELDVEVAAGEAVSILVDIRSGAIFELVLKIAGKRSDIAVADGALLRVDNLADVDDPAEARDNLGLATVAATGSYLDLIDVPAIFDGAYDNLTGRPTLATVATTGSYLDLIDVPAIFDGAYDNLTGRPTLAAVATTGSYLDLTSRPSLKPVATTGSYLDLTNRPYTVPPGGAPGQVLAKASADDGDGTWLSIAGDMLRAHNLSDLASATEARSNLGLKAVAASGQYNDLLGRPADDNKALGVDQAWADVTTSRTYNVSYQNTTSRPIMVACIYAGNGFFQVANDGTDWVTVTRGYSGTHLGHVSAVIPAGHYYRVSGISDVRQWSELR